MSAPRQDRSFDKELLAHLMLLTKHADHLQQVAEASANFEAGRDFSNLVKGVATATGLSLANVEDVLTALQTMAHLRARLHLTNEELIAKVEASLEEQAAEAGAEGDVDLWRVSEERILVTLRTLGSDHPILVTRKLERLAYAHRCLLAEARIITELRPVFNDAGTSIIHGLVVNTLVIDFYEGNDMKRIELGVDSTDLAELRRVTQRAESKALILKGSLEGLPWRSSVYPEEEGN